MNETVMIQAFVSGLAVAGVVALAAWFMTKKTSSPTAAPTAAPVAPAETPAPKPITKHDAGAHDAVQKTLDAAGTALQRAHDTANSTVPAVAEGSAVLAKAAKSAAEAADRSAQHIHPVGEKH
jgi:hypothetical protein